MAVTARIEGVFDGVLRGWALDSANTRQRLELIVVVDGVPIGNVKADRPRGDLQRHFASDGAHGFECLLPLGVQDGERHVVALRPASTAEGPDIANLVKLLPRRAHMLQGKIERVRDGRLVGWVWDRGRPDTSVVVELLCEGAVLFSAAADHLRQDLVRAGIGSGRHGLVMPLNGLPLERLQGMEATLRVSVEDEHWVMGLVTLPAPVLAPASSTTQNQKAQTKFDAQSVLRHARDAERERDFQKAAAILDEGLSSAPGHFDFCFLRARVAMALNEVATARKFAIAASQARPASPRPKVILARIAAAEGRHDEAVDLWERIEPGDDYYRERLLKRGRSLLVLSRAPEALREFLTATRLNPLDVDALRGAAQAAEGIGSLRAAHRQWQRYLVAAPEDQVARQHVADLAKRLAPSEAVPSPLQDPWLHQWPDGVEGEAAGEDWVQPTMGTRLRCRTGKLRFAAAAPYAHRPGEPARFGIWFHAEGAAAELDFALAIQARPALEAGLRMAMELMPHGEAPVRRLRLALAGGKGRPRILMEDTMEQRPRLFDFPLKLSALEADKLSAGQLSLLLTVDPGPPLTVHAPRPFGVLHSGAQSPSGLAEDGVAHAQLAKLGLLPRKREKAA